jgi:tetratricopeptide (TPR) repeat protein
LYLQVTFLGASDDPATRARAKTAAARAYELDPDLPKANVVMGLFAESLADALKYLRRAVEVDPSYADAFHLIGDQIVDVDREPALSFYRKSLALDPRLDVSRIDAARVLSELGRENEARKELQAVSRPGGGASLADSMVALIDLDGGRYAQAATELAAMPNVRSAPASWVLLASALRLADRANEALSEATALQSRFPQDCEARAVLAALQTERGQATVAHRLADGPIAASTAESALPSDVRCGLHAAAALRNAAVAVTLMDKVRGERLLHGFATRAMGASGATSISPRSYPWSMIASEPTVQAARQRLDAAYAHEREIARTVLAGLP